jgi:hypothetical protein
MDMFQWFRADSLHPCPRAREGFADAGEAPVAWARVGRAAKEDDLQANVHVDAFRRPVWTFAMWDCTNAQPNSGAGFVWMFAVWDYANVHLTLGERSTWMFA